MKITKYEHACLVLELEGKKLVIDPGEFSLSLPELSDVVAIVITHVHFDHFNLPRVEKLLAGNPEAQVLSVNAVKEQLSQVSACSPGSDKRVGPFSLQFTGGQHAIIHDDYPKFENIGVLVNEVFYYGGDSLIEPKVPVKALAIPASSPWAKTGEVMDYAASIRPELAFPTHDALNSPAGNSVQDNWFNMHSEKHGFNYRRLAIGETIEI